MAETETKGASEARASGKPRPVPPLPSDAIAIIPVRDIMLFPGVVMPVTVGRARSIAAAQQAVREQRQIGILMQRDRERRRSAARRPAPHRHRRQRHALRHRARWRASPRLPGRRALPGRSSSSSGWPFLVARVQRISEPEPNARPRSRRASCNLQRQALEALELLPQAPPELIALCRAMRVAGRARRPRRPPTWTSSRTRSRRSSRRSTSSARMDKVSRLLAHRIEVLRLSQEIGRQTKAALDERQREVLLREQMAAIQRQLGEGERGQGAGDRRARARRSPRPDMPKEVEDQARKELRRLERMPEAAAEYGMVRTYLDWLIELPWALPEEQPIDIAEARKHPRRGPLRPRQDQAPHRRVSRRAQARAARARRRSCASSVRRASARRRSGSRSRAP